MGPTALSQRASPPSLHATAPARSQTWTNCQPWARGFWCQCRWRLGYRCRQSQLRQRPTRLLVSNRRGCCRSLAALLAARVLAPGRKCRDAVVPADLVPGAWCLRGLLPGAWGQFPASAGFVVAWHWCIGRGTYTRPYLTASRSAAVNRKSGPRCFSGSGAMTSEDCVK